MITLLLVMFFPVVIALLTMLMFKKQVTFWEFALQVGAVLLIACAGLAIAEYKSVADTELWNGQVSRRDRTEVSCRHSYKCNCYTTCSGYGKSRSCTETCSTCYEHSYDVDWTVSATTGERIDIDTVDRQGLVMPPRWRASFIGEPFSSQHTYDNYILASPDTVLLGGRGDKRFEGLVPSYPQVYDIYRANHFINAGNVPNVDSKVWNWLLNEVNKELGPKKQVNVLLIVVKTADPAYMLELRDKWTGAKKNDVVVVIGSMDGHKIEFAGVLSWSPSELMKVELKDDIQQIGTLDMRDDIVHAIYVHVSTQFARMHMKDYKYLMHSYEPSHAAVLVLFFICLIVSGGLAFWSITNEFTNPISFDARHRQSNGYTK